MKTRYSIRAVQPTSVSRLVPSCIRFLESARDHILDRLLGMSSGQTVITESSIAKSGGDNCGYGGSHWLPVRRALKSLKPGSSDVFVDLGSGIGKVLVIAGRLPYRRVIGVEIDDELSRCAKINIEQARPRSRAREVDVITASVLEWPVPDEASVIFMFNPFIGQTFRTAVANIFESYDRRPRTLHIVYRYPWEHDWLLSTGRVVVDGVWPSNWPARPRWWQTAHVIISYRVIGLDETSQSGSLSNRLIRPRRAAERWSSANGQLFTISEPDGQTIYSRS